MSNVTNKYKGLYITTNILSILCLLIPAIFAVIYGYNSASPIQALGLSGSMLAAIFMVTLSLIFKWDLHSWIWLIVIGLGLAINNFYPFLVMIGICSLVEEIILRPMAKSFKAKYITNKEIDKRLL